MNKTLSKEVSFDLAKLLKEKEYNEKPHYIGSITDYVKGYCFDDEDKESTLEIIEFQFKDNVRSHYYLMPTISEVLDWIFEKYGIWIYCMYIERTFYSYIVRNESDIMFDNNRQGYDLASEAYEAAIKYTIKNLVKNNS